MSDGRRPLGRWTRVGACVIALVGAVVGHGGIEHFVVAGLFVMLGACTALEAVLAMHIRPHVRDSAVVALRLALPMGLVAAASFALGIPIGDRLSASTQAWCERQVPAIERHQREHGRYPSRLEAVVGLEPVPWLVRPTYETWNGDTVGYRFLVPHGIDDDQWWWSNERRWQRAYVARLAGVGIASIGAGRRN